MSRYTYDFNPVETLVADAIGAPGERTFFIQACTGDRTLSLALEKEEVANLALGVLQLLEDLAETDPGLATPPTPGKALRPRHPIEPAFRVRQLILGYDEDEDRIWLVAKALVIEESGRIADPDKEPVPSARMVATREQMRRMSEHALDVVEQGRPLCPLCHRPVDRSGHFCPRTDGEAMPIIF